jgi:hypothetical protein
MFCFAGLPLTPVTHAHADPDGVTGVQTLFVHSHREAHRHLQPHADSRRDDLVVLDDHHDDDVIVTLDAVFAVHPAYVLTAPATSLVMVTLEPLRCECLPASTAVERLVHGPPRVPAVVRGPPVSSSL